MAAGHPKGQRRVLLPTDPVEAIEKSVRGISIDLIILIVRLLILLRIETEYL